jgi:hypothetical protein
LPQPTAKAIGVWGFVKEYHFNVVPSPAQADRIGHEDFIGTADRSKKVTFAKSNFHYFI